MKQVLINLVKNAKKFTPKGTIEILAAYDYEEGCLYVHVKDTGKGIAEEDLRKLFTRFGKLQRTALANSEGIGLGLNIVRTIIEKAGGSINVHSDGVDKGSTFYFRIPMKAGTDEQYMLLRSGTNSCHSPDVHLSLEIEEESKEIVEAAEQRQN